jgi:hypothetical protein
MDMSILIRGTKHVFLTNQVDWSDLFDNTSNQVKQP